MHPCDPVSDKRIAPAPHVTGAALLLQVGTTGSGPSGLASTLKQIRGTGGTVKAERIKIQGDQRAWIFSALTRMGYCANRVGG